MIKKILLITHSSVMAGGAEDEFERLLQFFSEKKDVYELHGLFPKGPRSELYSNYCSKWKTYQWGFLPVIYENLRSYIKYIFKALIQAAQIISFSYGEKYDLVAVNVVVLIWPALVMSIIMRTRVVVFIREDIYPIKLRNMVYIILSKSCSFFIPNSKTKKLNFKEVTGNKKIQYIYPAVESELSLPFKKESLFSVIGEEYFEKITKSKHFKFINPAGVFYKKNQILILKALNEIKKNNSGQIPYIFFVGAYDLTSSYMKLLMDFIENNFLKEYCIFLGELPRNLLYEIYENTDAAILTSLSEGMPLVLVESFKFHKPFISTKVGGIPEVINSGENGFLVDFDEKQISDVMIKLMNDRELYDKVKGNAYSFYKENFNLDKALQETETIFQKVMNGTA